MKILLVAGGSGGHIYPCLEMAKHFSSNGDSVLLCGCSDSMEEKIYKDNGFAFEGVFIKKNKISSFIKSIKPIKLIYKKFSPDIVLLFGNYISVIFALVAFDLKIPIYLHEQNIIYGRANLLLGVIARRIYLSMPIKNNIYKKKSLLVGNPKSDTKCGLKKFDGRYNVVIAMGSLGSESMNKILKDFIRLTSDDVDYHIVIGKKYYSKFIDGLDTKKNIHLYNYLENLNEYMKSCDLFISRAGATTISEILVNGVATILIPSPYVKNNHQYLNAKYLSKNNACVLLEENSLSADLLNKKVKELIFNYKNILDLKTNAKAMAIYGTKDKIYKDLKETYAR